MDRAENETQDNPLPCCCRPPRFFAKPVGGAVKDAEPDGAEKIDRRRQHNSYRLQCVGVVHGDNPAVSADSSSCHRVFDAAADFSCGSVFCICADAEFLEIGCRQVLLA